jgi:hypothetical protein
MSQSERTKVTTSSACDLSFVWWDPHCLVQQCLVQMSGAAVSGASVWCSSVWCKCLTKTVASDPSCEASQNSSQLTGDCSSVSIVSDYGLDDRAIGVRSLAGEKDFSSNLCVQTGSGAHPASCTMGTVGSFPQGKARPGRDADHSPPSSAEVENE